MGKMEMETKVNNLENTNFMLEMKVKEIKEKEVQKKTELTEFTNKVFLLEMKVLEKEDIEKNNKERIEMMEEEKSDIIGENEKEKRVKIFRDLRKRLLVC